MIDATNDLDRNLKSVFGGDWERGMQLLITDHKTAGDIMTQSKMSSKDMKCKKGLFSSDMINATTSFRKKTFDRITCKKQY